MHHQIPIAAALALVPLVATPAAADGDRAPATLRMREPSPRVAWSPSLLGPRVAQALPDPLPGEPPATPADPAPAPDPAPDPAPIVAPPAASPPPRLTQAERAKLVEAEAKTEVITVAGTTLERELRTGRAPVTIVTRADLVAAGRTTIGDILQGVPSQANATNAQANLGGDGATRVSLRGLGAPRTLVLINGRRMVNGGAGADTSVDLNAIPLAVIERVEVWKDGASAIYGADAIGGVVNLVTRSVFEGFEASLFTGTSPRGDGTEYELSAITGFATDDGRNNFVVSAGFQSHSAVVAGDRAFSTYERSYDFATRTEFRGGSTATAAGRLDASSIDTIGTGVPDGLAIPGCRSGLCKPDGAGGWTNFTEPDDLYNFAADNYLYTPSTRFNLFVTSNRKLGDRSAIFFEGHYLHRSSDRRLSAAPFVADFKISKHSLYNPFGGDVLDYRRRLDPVGPRRYLDDVGTSRLLVGIVGEVPAEIEPLADWKYELTFSVGRTGSANRTEGQLNRKVLADALGPSMINSLGVPICVRTPGDESTRIEYSGTVSCVPLNILGPASAITADQIKGITYPGLGDGVTTQRVLLGTASGRLAQLPNHGDLSLAVGSSYRSDAGTLHPDPVAGTGYTSDNVAREIDGAYNLLEGFAELSIVPISEHALARWVELDVGARVFRHSQFGRGVSYKAGGLVRTVHGIAARGTYSTAFRAPTIPDLYQGLTERTSTAQDPCDARPPSVGGADRTLDPRVQAQCSAQGVPVGTRFGTGQQLSVVGGNDQLRPETARIATLGVVVEPPPIPGLALTADYWHVQIDDAIQSLGVQLIFANCYDRGIQASCDQIHRDPISHQIRPVDQLLQNIGRTTTSGLDLAASYDARLGELGRLHGAVEAQYLVSYDLETADQVIHGRGRYDLGVYPRYKANLASSWAHPSGASAGLALRFVGAYQECAGNNCNSERTLTTASREVDRYWKLDLFGGYELTTTAGKVTMQVGVNNLLDATPPTVYNAPESGSDGSAYDFVGRMVYARMTYKY
jgi:iron complex outermembrane recepter protein